MGLWARSKATIGCCLLTINLSWARLSREGKGVTTYPRDRDACLGRWPVRGTQSDVQARTRVLVFRLLSLVSSTFQPVAQKRARSDWES